MQSDPNELRLRARKLSRQIEDVEAVLKKLKAERNLCHRELRMLERRPFMRIKKSDAA